MVILKKQKKSVIFQALLLSHFDDDGSKTHEKATERDRGKRNFFFGWCMKRKFIAIVRMLCYWRQIRATTKPKYNNLSTQSLSPFHISIAYTGPMCVVLSLSLARLNPTRNGRKAATHTFNGSTHIYTRTVPTPLNIMVVLLPCGLLFILGCHVSERLEIVFGDGERARVRSSVHINKKIYSSPVSRFLEKFIIKKIFEILTHQVVSWRLLSLRRVVGTRYKLNFLVKVVCVSRICTVRKRTKEWKREKRNREKCRVFKIWIIFFLFTVTTEGALLRRIT